MNRKRRGTTSEVPTGRGSDERKKELGEQTEGETKYGSSNAPKAVRYAMRWHDTWGERGRQVTMEYMNSLAEGWKRLISGSAVSDWPGVRKPCAAERGKWESEPYLWRNDEELGEVRVRIAVCPPTRLEEIIVEIRREKPEVQVGEQADVSRILKGRLQHAVRVKESAWNLCGEGEHRRLEVRLRKSAKHIQWTKTVLRQ